VVGIDLVQNQDKFLAEMEVASVYAGKRMARQVGLESPLKRNSTTCRATDGSFSYTRQCRAVITAGEWQVETPDHGQEAATS
jgi:hypothetical protein